MKFVFASGNKGKLLEVQQICNVLHAQLVSPLEVSATFGPPPDPEEGAVSYEANAQLKAEAFFVWCKPLGVPIIADDTGLEVQALGGAPGVLSARFAGKDASMQQNKTLLLDRLKHASIDRAAQFRCTLCYVPTHLHASGSMIFAEETLIGSIAEQEDGTGGFGYDSLFIVGNTGKTLAHLKQEGFLETHRYKAFQKLLSQIGKPH